MVFTRENDQLACRIGAGVIVVFAVALAATLLISGFQWRKERLWHAFGTFEEGLSGLKLGSPVRLGGVVMGRVVEIQMDRSVRPREDPGGLRPLGPSTGGFLISFLLDASVELRADAHIVLDQNAISGVAELDILSVGGTRAAPLPGPIDASARRAPVLDRTRALNISPRQPALVRILGRDGARNIDRIVQAAPGIRRLFMDSEGAMDPATGEPWGPGRPSSIATLQTAIGPLAESIRLDRREWQALLESLQREWQVVSSSLETAEPGAEAPAAANGPIRRIQQLAAAFDTRTGLRAVWSQLIHGFQRPQSTWWRIGECLGPIGWQASLMASMARLLWPEIRNDLLVTKTQFVLGSTELWLLMNVDLLLTVIRVLQPFPPQQRSALLLILAANRAAITAESLRSAIENSLRSIAEGSSLIEPQVTSRLEREVLPVLRRYRRDLADLMQALDSLAAGQR